MSTQAKANPLLACTSSGEPGILVTPQKTGVNRADNSSRNLGFVDPCCSDDTHEFVLCTQHADAIFLTPTSGFFSSGTACRSTQLKTLTQAS